MYIRKIAPLFYLFVLMTSGSRVFGSLDAPRPVHVSMLELITVGEKYDGWLVGTTGVIYFNRENSLLFFSREKYQMLDSTSSIYLNFSDENGADMKKNLTDASGKYVFISGKYYNEKRKKDDSGEISYGPWYAGSLENLSEIVILE